MAKGSIAKEAITKKILEIFEGSFPYSKEIRIPYNEDGQRVEIKVTLTCAKENVGGDDVSAFIVEDSDNIRQAPADNPTSSAPTEEEKANIANLMAKLGL